MPNRLLPMRGGDFIRILAILAVLVWARPEPAGAQKDTVSPRHATGGPSDPAPPGTREEAVSVPEEARQAPGVPDLEPAELPDRVPPKAGELDEALRLTEVPGLEPAEFPDRVPPRAVARFEGTPSPGLQVVLSSEGSTGSDARVRWVQTQGPPVVLDDPLVGKARMSIPEGATGTLGFLLVVGNALGVDTTTLTIPIEARNRNPLDPTLRADAGDDQIGLVGRMVTLNAIRSEPRGRIGYRWIQVGGPTIKLKIEDGYTYSFIPPAPGIFRFALVVAAGGQISEPARVNVTVASDLPAAAPPSAAVGVPPAVAAYQPLDELARLALSMTVEGAEAADPLAEAFDAIAGRMDLYRTFADIQSEMARRLEEIVPQDPGRRQAWIDRLFTPLTARLIGTMLAEGLDLRVVEGQNVPLSAAQRARLAEQYRLMAEGFRATVAPH